MTYLTKLVVSNHVFVNRVLKVNAFPSETDIKNCAFETMKPYCRGSR